RRGSGGSGSRSRQPRPGARRRWDAPSRLLDPLRDQDAVTVTALDRGDALAHLLVGGRALAAKEGVGLAYGMVELALGGHDPLVAYLPRLLDQLQGACAGRLRPLLPPLRACLATVHVRASSLDSTAGRRPTTAPRSARGAGAIVA